METFEQELAKLINKYPLDNESNTPDFILAQFLQGCLNAFNAGLRARDGWNFIPCTITAGPATWDITHEINVG